MSFTIQSPLDPASAPAGANRHRWGSFIALYVVSALLMVAVMATVPEPSGKVALIYRPTLSATETFLRAATAGSRPIRAGNFPWIVVVAPDPDVAGFNRRAFATGALAIVNPMVVGGCS
jgi:hypothetical protein